MFVCIVMGCNKAIPEIYDVVPAEKLVELATKLNSGELPQFHEHEDERGELSINDGLILENGIAIKGSVPVVVTFILDKLNYKPKVFNCTICTPTLVCEAKQDRTIAEIFKDYN